jgi:hypothetical protein
MSDTDVHADRGARAAGRDFNEGCDQRLQFVVQMMLAAADPSPPPKWDSPHLADCPHCGRKWLSKMAMLCLTCGYSLQLARERAERDQQFRWELTIVAVPLLALSLLFTPSLDTAAAARSHVASLTYATGSLVMLMSSILTAVTGWVWWRWWRRSNGNA